MTYNLQLREQVVAAGERGGAHAVAVLVRRGGGRMRCAVLLVDHRVDREQAPVAVDDRQPAAAVAGGAALGEEIADGGGGEEEGGADDGGHAVEGGGVDAHEAGVAVVLRGGGGNSGGGSGGRGDRGGRSSNGNGGGSGGGGGSRGGGGGLADDGGRVAVRLDPPHPHVLLVEDDIVVAHRVRAQDRAGAFGRVQAHPVSAGLDRVEVVGSWHLDGRAALPLATGEVEGDRGERGDLRRGERIRLPADERHPGRGLERGAERDGGGAGKIGVSGPRVDDRALPSLERGGATGHLDAAHAHTSHLDGEPVGRGGAEGDPPEWLPGLAQARVGLRGTEGERPAVLREAHREDLLVDHASAVQCRGEGRLGVGEAAGPAEAHDTVRDLAIKHARLLVDAPKLELGAFAASFAA